MDFLLVTSVVGCNGKFTLILDENIIVNFYILQNYFRIEFFERWNQKLGKINNSIQI